MKKLWNLVVTKRKCFWLNNFSKRDSLVESLFLHKNNAKEEVYYVCVQVVENRGSIVTRLIKKDHAEVFGIRVLPFGVWSPISQEEMRTASLTTPNGIELEPE